jgi:predicted dehydrogenase
MRQSEKISRRDVLAAGSALCGFTFLPSSVLGRGNRIAPNDKVNIAYIGIGGLYGRRAFQELSGNNVVALCEVDWRQIGNRPSVALQIVAKYPEAKRFDDYRVMLQEMDKKIDAVVVCSADHMHAHPSIAAMKMGKHVYCEKAMAHSSGEVKAMVAAERKYKVSTQMGIQGHASDDVRSVVEWIRDGAIGTVKEVHVFEGARQPGAARNAARGRGGRGPYDNIQRVNEEIPIPPEVKWDLWLGAAPARPYNPMYLQGGWRRWLDFGTGSVGDHGSHLLDVPCFALDLGYPETIQAETDPEYDPETNRLTWPRMAVIRYTFPARGKRPALTLTWHSGHMPPLPDGWKPEDRFPSNGGMFVGTGGYIFFGEIWQSRPYPESLGKPPAGAWPGAATSSLVKLYPDSLNKEYRRPARTLPRPASHWIQWIDSLRAGKPGDANFAYSGKLSQLSMLGNIAIRNKGKLLHFDAKKERFTDEAANRLIDTPYRKGWALPK